MTLHVLFIGNSHTYLHEMPHMLAQLVKAVDRGFELAVEQCTGKGVSLEGHWKNHQTRRVLSGRKWDFVVLQERSGGPLENLEAFETYTRLIDEEIKKIGAETILFMTWALKTKPETQQFIVNAYGRLAEQLGVKLAPVGLAWQKAGQLNPDLDLYHHDGRHANSIGAYLTACVFYAVLLRETPEGLPGMLVISGRKRVDLDKESALFLQGVAHETVFGV